MVNLNTFFLLFAFGCVAYVQNKKKNDYLIEGGYKNVSPMKHDIIKDMFIQLIPLIVISQGKLFDKNNIFNSIAGTMLLNTLGYLIFYQIIEPYVLNKTPNY